MRLIRRIVIHHSASPDGSALYTAEDVDRWHKERGFSGNGYHRVFEVSGIVSPGRPLHRAGAHALGHNGDSVGLCLMGMTKFTIEQWESVADEVSRMLVTLGEPEVVGHYQLDPINKASCPGFDVRAWVSGGMKPLDGHIMAA